MSTLCASEAWFSSKADDVKLAALPLFHVTGMQGGMNCPIYSGATVVLLSRWDRDLAAQCIKRYKVSSFSAIPTMIVDLLASPNLAQYDLSSLKRLNGGGAAMPEAIAQKLADMGLTYVEGYGLSETIAPSHYNPPDRAKKQCLGIPIFGVESYIVDPITLEELPNGETGEIIIHGPQVFKGYWQQPQATLEALINWRGKVFLRTGDLAREDSEGYFFMVDRLKRMINSSGFKVWPAEVELMLYRHPHVQEACVIASKDTYRGETVKALVVIKDEFRENARPEEIMAWANEQIATYKAPKLIEFVSHLPKSASGKIMWRELQELEAKKSAVTP
jgi:fatty-acyl-CoA synthase